MPLKLKLVPGEAIMIGDHIKVTYEKYQGRRAQLAIDARGLEVHRVRLDGTIVPKKEEEDDDSQAP